MIEFDDIEKALKHIVHTYGTDTLCDNVRMSALLPQLMPYAEASEREPSLRAVKSGACDLLVKVNTKSDSAKKKAMEKAVKLLVEKKQLDEYQATITINNFSYALEWNLALDLPALPEPPAAASAEQGEETAKEGAEGESSAEENADLEGTSRGTPENFKGYAMFVCLTKSKGKLIAQVLGFYLGKEVVRKHYKIKYEPDEVMYAHLAEKFDHDIPGIARGKYVLDRRAGTVAFNTSDKFNGNIQFRSFLDARGTLKVNWHSELFGLTGQDTYNYVGLVEPNKLVRLRAENLVFNRVQENELK